MEVVEGGVCLSCAASETTGKSERTQSTQDARTKLLDLLGVILVLPSDKSETIPSSRLHLSNLFRASSTVTLNGSASSCQLFRYPPRRREDESRRPCGLHASTTALPPLSPWKGRAVRRVGGSRSSRRPAILLIGPFHPTVLLCALASVSFGLSHLSSRK